MKLAALLIVAMCSIAAPLSALAQYPDRPIRIIVPYGPASNSDTMVRVVATKLGDELGVPVVVENRVGASGVLGTEWAQRQKPDGYTIFVVTSGTMGVIPNIQLKTPYEPETFVPLAYLAGGPLFLVTYAGLNDGKVHTFKDFVAYGKANPGVLNYGFGTPGAWIITAEVVGKSGIAAIPLQVYASEALAMPDLLTGRSHFMFVTYSVMSGYLNSGKLRVLAVLDEKRSEVLPDVPNLKELGIDWDFGGWVGLMAPAHTPKESAEKLSHALRKVLAEPGVKTAFQNIGMQTKDMSPQEFSSFIMDEMRRYKKSIEENNIPRR